MGRFTDRIIMSLVALFLLAYVAYQAYVAIYGSIRTETAFEYTVSRTLPVEGIAIRTETVIKGEFSGIENYIVEDGARVTVGEAVAEFHESQKSDIKLRRSRELEAEIAMLKEAQQTAVGNFSSADMINRDIKEQIALLTEAGGDSRFDNISEIRDKLTSLINKKQIATGMSEGFESRIAALSAEYESIGIETAGDYVLRVQAPVSGYFCRLVDGYEESLSPELAADFGVDEYLRVIDGQDAARIKPGAGKIVQKQNWLFVVATPKTSLEFTRPGQTVGLSFVTADREIAASIQSILQEKENDRAVLVLACDDMSGELIKLRREDAVLSFSRYNGVRVNMADIRFINDRRGVYVLDGNTVRFKLIDPVYEEQSFVLSRLIPPGSNEDEYVQMFDQIITRGNDLYDGKPI